MTLTVSNPGFIPMALALMVAAVMAAPAYGQALSVRGIEIDATADTTSQAQRSALADGQVRAAQALINRLTLAEDRMQSDLPPISAETAAGLIAGLQISDEQRSSTRYRGVLSVDFDRRAVRSYLSGFGIAYVESQAAPVLVVPVLETASGYQLGSGPWHQAWLNGGFETALTPFIAFGSRSQSDGSPLGRGLITGSEALDMDPAALQALARAYGVDAVAVVLARQGGGSVRVSGSILEFGQGGPTRETLPTVAAQGGFADAARRLVERREDEWKRASVVRGGEEAALELTLLYGSFDEWRSLQRAVAGASLIENARLDALSRTGAAMTILHRGTRDQVGAELAARGARLEEDADLGWTVRPR
jgi:hypothetical protein